GRLARRARNEPRRDARDGPVGRAELSPARPRRPCGFLHVGPGPDSPGRIGNPSARRAKSCVTIRGRATSGGRRDRKVEQQDGLWRTMRAGRRPQIKKPGSCWGEDNCPAWKPETVGEGEGPSQRPFFPVEERRAGTPFSVPVGGR